MMEPSVHRDPRIINIDDLRPLFGENLPLFSGPLRRFTSLQGSASLSLLCPQPPLPRRNTFPILSPRSTATSFLLENLAQFLRDKRDVTPA